MKKKLSLLLLIIGASSNIFGQCTETTEPKILLIGDSWAAFMHADGTFNNVLDHWGHSNQFYVSNAVLAVSGAQTQDFLIESRMTEIQNQLVSNPSIEVVHISLTGNDFLGNWNVDYTPGEITTLSDETYDELITLTDFIKSVRPGIRIVFSGYMYANFEEVIHDVAPFETSHPFYATWENMGFPTFAQINQLLNDFSVRISDLALSDPQMDFINSPALMQYIYGQSSPLDVDPGGTYPALYQPLPYGDITYPSPKVAMRDYGLARDCFHLSVDGYYNMINYQFQKFYHHQLMDDAYFLAESALENGSVSGSGSVSSELKMGEAAGEEFATILSFNTTAMADTSIEAASIFLRRESLVGGNPIGATAQLTLKNGNLGSSVDLDTDDFDDEGDITATACIFGLSAENTDWIRIDLPAPFLPLIANDGNMQFSIRVEGVSGQQIVFTSGENPEFAPVFNVKYKSHFAGLSEVAEVTNDFVVYPNPTNGQLNFFSSTTAVTGIEILDMQGKTVSRTTTSANHVDVSNLVSGSYFVRIITENGVVVKSFIKR